MRAFNVHASRNVWWNLFDRIWDFCAKISGHIIEYTFFSLKIINKNIHKNILEILDQNRISIEVTFLYFSTNQLETQNKNILSRMFFFCSLLNKNIPDQKLINRKYLGSKINK